MRIVSWNVNGLRAVARRGFRDWLEECGADVVLLQETKASPEQLPEDLREPPGWFTAFASAERRGYSGVAIYARRRPDEVRVGLGRADFDAEGRFLLARYGATWIASAYFPNGGRDCARVPFKLDFYDVVLRKALGFRRARRNVLIGGDFNTAHREIDLARPRENRATSGFLDEERAWLDRYLEAGLVDTFRHVHPRRTGAYSWWTYRAGARERNVGWRLDYHLVDSLLAERIRGADVHPEIAGSDHCPVSLEIDG